MPENSLVACGMYAHLEPLQNAWRALFSQLPKFGFNDRPTTVIFRTDDDIYRDPALFLGHTCGYPYLKKWASTHRPVCAPMFAVDGCRGVAYSSWFITPAKSAVTDLQSARGKSVAVNGPQSNSGMNVLRHAVAELCFDADDTKQFFGEVVISGSHLRSLELIAGAQVELAAIDAVTYALQIAHAPELANRIRIIGQSTHTTGLPFIAPDRIAATHHPAITDALNECLHNLKPKHRRALKLNGFQQVSAEDYASIAAMEKFAVTQGYPQII